MFLVEKFRLFLHGSAFGIMFRKSLSTTKVLEQKYRTIEVYSSVVYNIFLKTRKPKSISKIDLSNM